jgi:hypothetical protein
MTAGFCLTSYNPPDALIYRSDKYQITVHSMYCHSLVTRIIMALISPYLPLGIVCLPLGAFIGMVEAEARARDKALGSDGKTLERDVSKCATEIIRFDFADEVAGAMKAREAKKQNPP